MYIEGLQNILEDYLKNDAPIIGPHTFCLLNHPLEKPKTLCLQDEFEKILAKEEAKLLQNSSKPVIRRSAKIRKLPKYRKYSFDLKKQVIQEIKDQIRGFQGSLSSLIKLKARLHNIHPKNIFRWISQRKISKLESGRKARYPELEKKLVQFIKINPYAKRRKILKEAQKIKKELNLEGEFFFSKGWYERFKSRFKNKYMNQKYNEKAEEWVFSLNEEEDSNLIIFEGKNS